jgi:hypothetical protein
MADLASIISGTDPLAPLMLQAEQQQQLLNSARDASQWQNQGWAGALARTIAGVRGGGQNDALNQIVQQRMGAYPDIVKMLAAPEGATSYAAANPNISPLAMSMVANQTPTQAAQGRELSIANQLGSIDLTAYQQRQRAQQAAAGGGTSPGVISAPVATRGAIPAPVSASATMAPQQQPSLTNGASLAPPQTTGAQSIVEGTLPTSAAFASVSPAARAAALAKMAPAQRSAFIAQMRGMLPQGATQ